jgi:hypothetical protein
VFTETKTNRSPQLVTGAIAGGLVANAFVGASSDGSKRAVFAALGLRFESSTRRTARR